MLSKFGRPGNVFGVIVPFNVTTAGPYERQVPPIEEAAAKALWVDALGVWGRSIPVTCKTTFVWCWAFVAENSEPVTATVEFNRGR
jgi:hypothetical protein